MYSNPYPLLLDPPLPQAGIGMPDTLCLALPSISSFCGSNKVNAQGPIPLAENGGIVLLI